MKLRFFIIPLFVLAIVGSSQPTFAQEAFLGEIRWFGFNFCPRGWYPADGQLLSIANNSALFSLLGTTYGGDGKVTFALPDLRGRVPVHTGNGPGLTQRRMGSRAGQESVALSQQNLPSHSHNFSITAKKEPAATTNPDGNFLGGSASYRSTGTDSTLRGGNTEVAGESQPVNNMQPYLTLNACIAAVGIFPSRG